MTQGDVQQDSATNSPIRDLWCDVCVPVYAHSSDNLDVCLKQEKYWVRKSQEDPYYLTCRSPHAQ